jgi:hypothetical protein
VLALALLLSVVPPAAARPGTTTTSTTTQTTPTTAPTTSMTSGPGTTGGGSRAGVPTTEPPSRAVAVAPIPPRVTFPAGVTCPRVILYGIRGSGELPQGSTPDPDNNDLGKPVAEYFRKLKATFGNDRVGALASGYPAAPVPSPTNPQDWLDMSTVSVPAGEASGVADIRRYIGRCPTSQFVIAGYSQGVWVARRIIRQLEPDLNEHIAHHVFFGDPWFRYDEPGVIPLGGAVPGREGILAETPGSPPALPSGAVTTHSWCHAGDVVCQWLPGSTAPHLTYQRDVPMARNLTSFRLRERGIRYGVALRTSVTVSSSPARAGGAAEWRVGVSNMGVRRASGQVKVKLVVSDGSPVASATGSGWSCARGTCVHANPTGLVSGEGLPGILVQSSVLTASTTNISLSARIDDRPNDGVAGNVETFNAQPVAAGGAPHLQPSVTAVGAPFAVGGVGTWTVRVKNTGPLPSSGTVRVNLHVNSHAGASIDATGVGWTCIDAVCTHPGTVATGATLPDLSVRSAPFGVSESSATLTASVDDTRNSGQDPSSSAQQTSPVSYGLVPHLQPSVQPVGAPFHAGGTAAFTVQVKNTGARAAAGSVRLDMSLYKQSGGLPDASGTGWVCIDLTCVHPGPVAAGAVLPAITVRSDRLQQGDGSVDLSVWIDDTRNGGQDRNSSARAQAPVVVGTVPHLQLSVQSVGAPYLPDSVATWNVRVRNTGGSATTGAIVAQLELSQGEDYLASASGSGWTCVEGTCLTSAVAAAGASLPTIVVRSVVVDDRNPVDHLTLTASIDDTANGGVDPTAYASQAAAFGRPGAALDLAASLNPPSAPTAPGGTASTVVKVRNVGALPVSSGATVTFSDSGSIPVASASGTGWTCSVPNHTCTTAQVVAAGDTLPSITLRAPVGTRDVDPGRSYGIFATVAATDDDNPFNNWSSGAFAVAGGPVDLAVVVTGTGLPVVAGGGFNRTVMVTNAGRSASSGSITVSFSTELPVTSAAGTGWVCSLSNSTCSTDTSLSAGQTLPPITLQGSVPTVDLSWLARTYSTWVSVEHATDSRSGNNVALVSTAVTQPLRDLAVVVNAAAVPTAPGGAQTSTVVVSNQGSLQSTGTITVNLSTAFSGATAVGTGWVCSVSSQACSTDTAVAVGAALPPITVTTPVPASDVQWFQHPYGTNADVSNTADGISSNNSSAVSWPVQQPAVDLSLSVSGGTRPVLAGENLTAAIVVHNTGRLASTGTITVNLSGGGGSTVTAASGTGWTCVVANNACSTPATVAPGGQLPAISATLSTDAQLWDRQMMASADVRNASDGWSPNNAATVGVWAA